MRPETVPSRRGDRRLAAAAPLWRCGARKMHGWGAQGHCLAPHSCAKAVQYVELAGS